MQSEWSAQSTRSTHALEGVRRAQHNEHKPKSRVLAQGLIAVLLVGGMAGFTGINRTIRLDVDGEVTRVNASARTVGGLLEAQGISLSERDLVAPQSEELVPLNGDVVVRHARELILDVDGHRTSQWTVALNVEDAMETLGIRAEGALLSTSRSTPIGREGMALAVSTAKNVTVVVDGQAVSQETSAPTVGEVLIDYGISLGERDFSSVPLSAPAVEGMVTVVNRTVSEGGKSREIAAYETIEEEDAKLDVGIRKVVTAGKVGEKIVTYRSNMVDGQEVGREPVSEVIISAPVDEVIKVGTREPDTTPIQEYAGGSPKAIGREMAAARGYGDQEFSCLEKLWDRESGWNPSAANRSSGAYGIPQALPGSKMASAGADWRTNPATQISWGLGYVESRYGTPCGAWSAFQSKGWY